MTRSLYRCLLWLHPPAFRDQFAEEMLWIYDETASAGIIPLFTDGTVSLARQWLMRYETWTLAAAGFSGALQMLMFLILVGPLFTAAPTISPVSYWSFAPGAVGVTSAQLSGNWLGFLRSTGFSAPVELMLIKRGAAWSGKLYLQGQDGRMHGGALEDLSITGDSIRFRVQSGDADMMFTGRLHQGRLTGILEATAKGEHEASSPKGRRIGQGTWAMTPARPLNAAGAKHRQS
jgi:hypothetical protein